MFAASHLQLNSTINESVNPGKHCSNHCFFKSCIESCSRYFSHYYLLLTTGNFPSNFKYVTIFPHLKKSSFDPSVLSNFRPISKLPNSYQSLHTASSFMNNNRIFETFQSDFCFPHSTETTLVKVTNDLLLAAMTRLYSIFILLLPLCWDMLHPLVHISFVGFPQGRLL